MKWMLMIGCVVCFGATALAQQLQTAKEKEATRSVVLKPVNSDQANSKSFFCRKEWQLEKTIKVPVKIRVGSIDQCNYLEQKPGYTSTPVK